jgi:hypothetical protein
VHVSPKDITIPNARTFGQGHLMDLEDFGGRPTSNV